MTTSVFTVSTTGFLAFKKGVFIGDIYAIASDGATTRSIAIGDRRQIGRQIKMARRTGWARP